MKNFIKMLFRKKTLKEELYSLNRILGYKGDYFSKDALWTWREPKG